MIRLTLLLCVVFFMHPTSTEAQFHEAGVFVGISHYSGDLTERQLEPLGFHRAGGFYLRQKLSSRFNLKYQFYKGRISGDDGRSSEESGLWRRNLSFESDVFEIAAVAEYSFFKFGEGLCETSPYVFGGLAGFYFAPQTQMNGRTYNLNTYRTEGVEYSLYQFALPFGAGVKMKVNDRGFLGLELGFRKTFTDYLDDVSGFYPADLTRGADGNTSLRTALSYRGEEVAANANYPSSNTRRGNPEQDDWYMFFGLSLGISL